MDKDPIYDEFEFCDKCEPHVEELVKYVRNLENTLIVAKQTIQSLSVINKKLSKKQRKDNKKKLWMPPGR